MKNASGFREDMHTGLIDCDWILYTPNINARYALPIELNIHESERGRMCLTFRLSFISPAFLNSKPFGKKQHRIRSYRMPHNLCSLLI